MSIVGKGASSFKKKDVVEQKSIALGFKKMVFAHKATAGEAGINTTALIAPPEMSSYGFVNPSFGAISRTNLFQFKNNLKIVSSISGLLIPYMSYTVNSATYIAFNGFTAAADEVFVGYIDEAPTTSLSVVDGEPIVASGTLLAGNTDFNIGMPIPLNQNPAHQLGAVMVFADRELQYRKVGNNPLGAGDYIEVPVAGGLGSLIRFNSSGSNRFITVVSNGVVAERPDGSMTALIERVQGQVDQMIPTLAAVAGVPESTFQTAPNDVDLKQFGDTVIDHETRIDSLEVTALRKWQEKGLISHNANSAIAGLTFNNMEIGKTYKYSFYGAINGSGTASYNITFNQAIGASDIRITDSDGQGGTFYYEKVFVASATTMVPTMTITDAGAGISAYARLEEMPDHVLTAEWT